MRKTFEVLEGISRASGSIKKLELLRTLKDNEFAKFYFETVFNKYLTYGVNPIESLGNEGLCAGIWLRELREKFINREVTGDAARKEMARTYSTSNPLWNKWIYMMWERNLRIGISDITINKVFLGLIPKFELQQCHSLDKGEELKGEWYVEPKLDGLRAVLVFEKGVCKDALSRNGRPLYNMEHIVQEIASSGFKEGVIDGEIAGSDWNESISTVRASKSKRDIRNIHFKVFDYIPIEEWKKREGKTILKDRKILLEKLYKKFSNFKYSSDIAYYKVKNSVDAWNYAKNWRDMGYEGAVAKRVDSVYEFGRSYNWLKLKFEETYDLVIVDMQTGSGKNKDRLGAFICKTGKGEKVNVGGGFTDEQRDEIWEHKKKYIGRIVEVKCQEKTKDGSLRFPVVVSDEKGNIKFREDKE